MRPAEYRSSPIMKCISMFGMLAALAATLVLSNKSLSQEKGAGYSALSLDVLIKVKPRVDSYIKIRQSQTKELALKYGKVIEARLNKAADAGDLKTAEAFQGEKEDLVAMGKAFAEELKDPVTAARKGAALPELGAGTPESLVTLRKIWTTELLKIRVKLDGELQQSLKKLEIDWTKARDFKNAKEVLTYRESLPSDSSFAVVADSKEAPTTKEPAKKSKDPLKRKDTRWKWGSGGYITLKRNGDAIHDRWRGGVGKWERNEDGSLSLTGPTGKLFSVKFTSENSATVIGPTGGSTEITRED